MDEFIKTFHIDWKLLIAQLVNFGIVVFVLWRFALKPIMKNMAQRSEEIGKSLEDAKRIEKELAETERLKEERLLAAQKDAQSIIESASQEAERIRVQKVEQTKKEMEQVLEKTKAQIAAEKDQMIAEARQQVGTLVIAATEKIITKKLDPEKDRELIESAIKSVR